MRNQMPFYFSSYFAESNGPLARRGGAGFLRQPRCVQSLALSAFATRIDRFFAVAAGLPGRRVHVSGVVVGKIFVLSCLAFLSSQGSDLVIFLDAGGFDSALFGVVVRFL
jgi:hypothetical protein